MVETEAPTWTPANRGRVWRIFGPVAAVTGGVAVFSFLDGLTPIAVACTMASVTCVGRALIWRSLVASRSLAVADGHIQVRRQGKVLDEVDLDSVQWMALLPGYDLPEMSRWAVLPYVHIELKSHQMHTMPSVCALSGRDRRSCKTFLAETAREHGIEFKEG